ncbi:MAG: hypothetical protein J6S23_03935 [Clostridia bacterium]|nr:hypothetical protein [Clostridia bacterium]
MENKRHKVAVKKGKFNFIDLVVVVLVLTIAFWCISYYYDLFTISNDTDTEAVAAVSKEIEGKLIYKVVIDDLNLREYELIDIINNPTIKNFYNDKIVGKMIGINYETYYVSEYDETTEKENSVEKKRATITVVVPARYVEGVGYFVNDRQIMVGKSLSVTFKVNSGFRDFNGRCSALTFSMGGIADD